MLASLFMLVFNPAKATENETTAPVYYKNTETIPYTVLKTMLRISRFTTTLQPSPFKPVEIAITVHFVFYLITFSGK